MNTVNIAKSINHNRIGALGFAALAAISLGASAPAPHAQADRASTSDQVDLYPGTVIPVKLSTELSSKTAQAGDTFTAAVDDSKEAYNSIMQGATVAGVVRHATQRSGTTPGTLDLAFTRLHLSDGRNISITGSPASLDGKDLTARADGVLVAKNTSKDNRLTYAGYGAGAGLLVGLLTGDKKIKIEDILLGGLAGYGAGTVLKSPQEVHDVDLQPGTEIGVRLDSRTRYYHKVPKATVKKAVKATHRVHRVRHAHTYYTYSSN